MEFLITTTNGNEKFNDPALTAATKLIFKLGDGIKKNWFAIAATVAKVDESKCYQSDGFESVHEWTEKTFGIKKTASYSLLTIGRDYTRTITNAKGAVTGYASNLTDDPNNDFSKTQIEKMLPAGHDVAETLVKDGKITPDMTAKKIEKIIKMETAPESEPETETIEPEAVTESESTDEPETVELADEHGVGYIVPKEIFEKYVKPYKE